MTDSVGTDISLRGGGKNRRRSWPRRARLVTAAAVALLCLIWFVPWAYVRMTTPVARAYDDYSDLFANFYPSDDDDATDEWLAALAAFPSVPTFNEPPPAGMKWKFQSGGAPPVDLSEMNAGRWDPASRPSLRVSIRYLSSAKLTSALTRIGGLVDRPWRFAVSMGATPDPPSTVSFSEMRQLARVLVARSRYRHETGDVVGAWEDIRAVLSICRVERREVIIHRLTFAAIEALALTELRLLLRRVMIDEPLANDIDRMLRSFPGLERSWGGAMTGELQLGLREIDLCFSDDGHGSGWLVLSSQPGWTQVWAGGWPVTTPQRSTLWNLLSPLYHDRQTTTEGLKRFYTRCAEAAGLTYKEGVARLQAMETRGAYEPSDGALLHMLGMSGMIVDRAYMHAVRQVASRRATRIMVALNCFRGEQGTYPVQLDDLVPRFIQELPADPFCGKSFGYRRVEGDDYIVYACGSDGDDDEGRPTIRNGTPRAVGENGDDIYTFQRRSSYENEPIAVPATVGDAASRPSVWGKP